MIKFILMDPRRQTFRKLCEGRSVTTFPDIVDSFFGFETLFYKNRFSYCCCTCGFDLEYLNFISESRQIHEDVYDKIVRCLEEGKCQHVQGMPDKMPDM